MTRKCQPPPSSKDDIEALSRGKPTKSKVGDVTVGHRLTQKERLLFERAKKSGILKLPLSGIRANVKNIYLKWCETTGTTPVISESTPKKR